MQFNQIIPKKVPKSWYRLPVFLLMMLWFANSKAQQLVNVSVKVTETYNNYDCCNDAVGICGFTNDFPEPRWKIRVRPYTNPTFSPTATIAASTCGTRVWDRPIGTYNGICEDRVVFEVESWEEDGCGEDDTYDDCLVNGDDVYSNVKTFTRTFLGGGPGTKTFVLPLYDDGAVPTPNVLYSITCDVTWSRVGLNVITAANRSVCRGDKATLTASNTDPDVNVIAFRWYSDASLSTLVFTGNPFTTPNIFADRSYWVTGVLEGGCETNPKKVDITVIEKPVAPIAPAVQTCLNGQALLTARSPIVGAIFTWYDDALGNVPLASGPTFLTPPLSAPRSYWVSVKDPAASCPSNLREVPVTVDLVLSAPTAGNEVICAGEEAVLTATATPGAEVRWYADEDLTNLLFIGTEFTVSPSGFTTYYLTQAVNGCTSGSSSVSVTVNPKPVSPVTSQQSVCSSEKYVNVSIPVVSGYSVNIYENGVLKLITPDGRFFYNFATSPATFTTIEYSYIDNITGCESDKANFYIVPYDNVEAPTAPNVALCVNEVGAIVSNSSSQAEEIRFYAADATTLLETDLGNTGSYSVSSSSTGTTTYYTSAVSADGCETKRMRVDVIVGGGAPTTAPDAEDATVCSGERAILTATGSVGGAMYWYSDAALTNLLFIGNPFETLQLTADATYYVAEGAGECGSSDATEVHVMVNPAASLPFATADYTLCQGQTIPGGEGLLATCSDASGGGINSTVLEGSGTLPIILGPTGGVGGTLDFDGSSIPVGSTVTSVSLNLNLAHTYAFDLAADLSSPGGLTANVIRSNASNDNFGTSGTTPLSYIFNDLAATYVVGTPGDNDIPSGSYLPNEPFSVFTGTNASGIWTLDIVDRYDDDGGLLSGASLSITYQLPADAGSLTWWDAPVGGAQVGSGSPFVPANYETLPIGQHTYYAQCDDASTCGNKRVAVNLNVLPAISSPLVSGDDAVCEGEQANLSVSNPLGTVEWYADDNLTIFLGTGSSFTTAPLTETTTFYVVNNNGNCSSEASSFTVEVNPLPSTEIYADPSPSFFSGNIEICEGTLVTLEVVLEDPSTQIALLYTEEEPGNLLADWLLISEDFFEINTMSDMIYYVRVYDQSTGCFSKPVPIYIDVYDRPTDVEVRGTTVCVDEPAIVHADVTTIFDNPGDNAQVMVYLITEDGIIIDAQDVPTGVYSFNVDFDLGTFSDPGTYNFMITTSNGYCYGTPQVVTVTVVDAPASPRVTDDVVCEGETAMLRAVASEGIVHWYSSMASSDVLQVGGVFTIPNATASTSYYVSAVNETGCESPRVAVGVTVNAKPAAPEVEAEEIVICLGQSATFNIVNPDPDLTYVWSSDPLGVDVWGTGETFETPALSQYTAFYVTAIDEETGCTSDPSAAWVIVDNTLVISSATATPACEGNDVHIQVAAWDVTGAVALYNWNLDLVDVAFIPDDDQGNDDSPWIADFYISDLPAGDYIYYVKEYGDYFFPCGSIPISVVVKVFENPQSPLVRDDTVCAGDAARLLATSTEGTIQWYMSSSSDVVLHTGAIFDIPAAYSNSTYWVSVLNENGCESDRVPVSVTVNALPETPLIDDVEACYGTPTDLEVLNADPDLAYEWATDPDFVYSFGLGGGIFTTGALFQNTTYYVRAVDLATGCVSPAVGVRIFVDNTLIVSNAISDPVCEGNDAVIKVSAWDVDAIVGLFDWNLNLVDIAVLPDDDQGDDNSPWVADFYIPDLAAGEYIYYVQEIGFEFYPCGSIPISVLVRVLDGPGKPEAMNDSPTCEGGDVLVSALAPDANTYSWSGPNQFVSNSQTFTINEVTSAQAGEYIVTVYDLSGCSAKDTTTVVVYPVPVLGEGQVPSYNAPLCERDTLKLFVGTIEGVSYEWKGPNAFTSSDQNPMVPNVTESDNQGFYSVQLTDAVTGCKSAWYTVLVNINKRPDNVVAVNDGPKCAGETINLSTGNVFGASYQWSGPNQYLADVRNPSIQDIQQENAGTYTVVVTVDGCSSDPATTEVVVYPNPVADAGADDTTEHGTPIQLNGSGGITYQWTPNMYITPSNNVPNPYVNPPLGENTYTLTVWNEYGCSDQDEVVITVIATDKLDIPEVFTPNGDGKNDTWIIGFLSDIGEYELCIYARDGAQLYCTKNYANDWNGTYKGDPLPDGTYWYVIKSSEHTYKGAVTIRR